MKLSKKNADNTPDSISDYIPISSPSIYSALILLLVVLVVVLIWGNIGRVPMKMTVKGVGLNAYEFLEDYEEDEDDDADTSESVEGDSNDVDFFLCLVDPNTVTSDKLNEKPATVMLNDGKNVSGTAVLLDTVPNTEEDLIETLNAYGIGSHWALERLDTGGYRYAVGIFLDKPVSFLQYGEIADVVIEIDQVPPIYYLKK